MGIVNYIAAQVDYAKRYNLELKSIEIYESELDELWFVMTRDLGVKPGKNREQWKESLRDYTHIGDLMGVSLYYRGERSKHYAWKESTAVPKDYAVNRKELSAN